MPALLTAADLASIRSALGILLTHTATITPMVDGTADSEGNVPQVPGTPVTGVACRYETVARSVRDEGGVTVVSIPTLAVDPTTTIAIGSRVSAITGSDGVLILAGPLRVERVFDDTAGLGAALQPTYELRGAAVGA